MGRIASKLQQNIVEELSSSNKQLTSHQFSDVIVNIKRILSKVPLQYRRLFLNAASLFLVKESVENISKLKISSDEILAYHIFEEKRYLDEALEALTEDAPVTAVGTGSIAGAGVGPQGEPGYKSRSTFRGCKVFEVDMDTFYKIRFGKNRYHTYKKYVGEDEVGQDIRNYGIENPDDGIILQHPTTQVMTFLKFPKRKLVKL